MPMAMPRPSHKVNILPEEFGSLAHGLPPAPPGTLFVRGLYGGMSVEPDARFELHFGRCEPDVHVCVGADDTRVSRLHGRITREDSRWVLHNVGKLPIRFPGARLVVSGQREELPSGYSPLFIVAPDYEHLLEVRVAARTAPVPATSYQAKTLPTAWNLNDRERLVLVCLAQRYLRQDRAPQPLTWAEVEDELRRVQPEKGWTWRQAAHEVRKVRLRLSARGVCGIREDDLRPGAANSVNHNLIIELLVTATLVKAHLALLDDPGPA
ncbi:hypothetical protein GCM10023191_019560 [Actinoallomurus oryzae]|uniref:FHA domain-containing protein n=1 Tax=Actinoallomurus oryzae TaxID=502180 RepID=A0ABP8PMF2_9ACTN